MYNLAIIGIGGFIGSVARYLVAEKVQIFFSGTIFPIGIIIVNISGCFLIGLISGFSEYITPLSPRTKFFLITGICGGYTTFSTFGNDTFILFREREILYAALNAGIQLIIGILAVYLGYVVSKTVSKYF